jgi:Lipid A 3-O-deacylase (PagL)
MTGLCCAFLFILLTHAFPALQAQSAASSDNVSPSFSRKNSFGVFTEYSNDSSHILIGNAINRKLVTLGATYSHRILLNHSVDMQYLVEVRPVLFVSDPVTNTTQNYFGPPANTSLSLSGVYTSPCPTKPFTLNETYSSGPYAGSPFTVVSTYTCSRRWTYGEGLSPLGLKFNLLPRHRLQPVFTMAAGYMFSTKPVPIPTAGSFNFTFEFGAGLELYGHQTSSSGIFGNRSFRAEYRYHHISNASTATSNPGIDSGLFQVTFAFGR